VPYYVTVSEGDDPGHTTPVLAVSDPAVVRHVLAVITRHFGAAPSRSTPVPLRPLPGPGPGEDRGGRKP
jgi:hypothetical protein